MTTDPPPFDPRRHLTKLSRRQRQADGSWRTHELDYLPVAARLLWLRTDHPEARLATTIERVDDHMCIVRAHIAIPASGAEASGIGSETPEDWKDYVEKAETKAVGRALAALGYGTQFCQDFAEGEAIADAPQESKPASAPAGREASQPMRQATVVANASRPEPLPQGVIEAEGKPDTGPQRMTDPQRKYLFKLVGERFGWKNGDAEEKLRQLIAREYRVERIHLLSAASASALIDGIQSGRVTAEGTAQPALQRSPDAATEKQIEAIKNMCRHDGWGPQETEEWVNAKTGGTLADLTKRQASELIEELKAGR